MLVTSTQSSTHRPLGLSVEELYELDSRYRRIEQQQHLTRLQTPTHASSSNLNRLASRSLDPLLAKPTSSTVLPSLEIQGHGYNYRPQTSSSNAVNYARSYSNDQLKYTAPAHSIPPSSLLKHINQQRTTSHDTPHQRYQSKHRTYVQQPNMATGSSPSSGNSTMYNIPPSSTDHYDSRNSCKLRRQHPLKRESSRRIVVRPVVQRRREPSVSSSCDSLDETRSSVYHIPTGQSNISKQSVPFIPSPSLTTDVINELKKETNNNLIRASSNNDSLSDDGDVNLYEMRLVIGKTYDTSDISVQLEGPKILIHCHTIEPTDKRGNYRKHEYKTELLVPDVVDDETIVAYLTEDGQLIVEGKYQPWAWKEIKRKRKIEQQEANSLTSPSSPSSTNPNLISTKNDGGPEQEKTATSLASNTHGTISTNTPMNRIEKKDNNRTVIHSNEPKASTSQQYTDTSSVSGITNRLNTLNTTSPPTIWDGYYRFTDDNPPILAYYVRLPYETLTDSIRIQSDVQLNILKILIEQKERSLLPPQQQSKVIIRSTSRICRLPRDHTYDYTRLQVVFLKDNYIRIELPTFK